MNRREIMKVASFLPMLPFSSAEVTPGPRTLPVQPEPVNTMVGRLGGITAITRVWAEGDELKCRLCPNCQASGIGVCTVLTKERVAVGDGALYRFPSSKN